MKPLCPVTARPLPPGFFLHPSLKSEIIAAWHNVANLMPEIERIITKEVRLTEPVGIRTIPGPIVPLNLGMLAMNEELAGPLNVWTNEVAAYVKNLRHDPPPALTPGRTWNTIAQFHILNIAPILNWKESPQYWDEIEHTVNRIIRVFNPPPAKKFTRCSTCGTANYFPATAIESPCQNCDTLLHIENETAAMWSRAVLCWWELGTTIKIVEFVSGITVPSDTLIKWAARAQIETKKLHNITRYQPAGILEKLRITKYNKG